MRPLPTELKAILVDFDGTLINSLPALWKCYRIFMQTHGLTPIREEFIELIGPSLDEIIIFLKKKYSLSESIENLYKEYRKLVVDAYATDLVLFPNALNLLQNLSKQGVKLALVTSATLELIEPFIKRSGLTSLFDLIITHINGEATKPSPAIYNRALEELNIGPDHAIAIEDSQNGVLSASAANLYVVHFISAGDSSNNLTEAKLEKASYVVSDWLELGKFVSELQPKMRG